MILRNIASIRDKNTLNLGWLFSIVAVLFFFYQLRGVLVHTGSYGGGHYTAYVKGKDDQWFLCDDQLAPISVFRTEDIIKLRAMVNNHIRCGSIRLEKQDLRLRRIRGPCNIQVRMRITSPARTDRITNILWLSAWFRRISGWSWLVGWYHREFSHLLHRWR